MAKPADAAAGDGPGGAVVVGMAAPFEVIALHP